MKHPVHVYFLFSSLTYFAPTYVKTIMRTLPHFYGKNPESDICSWIFFSYVGVWLVWRSCKNNWYTTQVLLTLYLVLWLTLALTLLLWLWHFLYSAGPYPVSSLHIYPLLCRGHSWRVRLTKQETLTPPGHLVSLLDCRGPWMSIVVLYCWCHSESASVLLYFTFHC